MPKQNLNGRLVLAAIKSMERPATSTSIVSHIAEQSGVKPNQLKEIIQGTIDGGVKHGFLQRSKRRYYAVNFDLDELNDDKLNTELAAINKPAYRKSNQKKRNASRRSMKSCIIMLLALGISIYCYSLFN